MGTRTIAAHILTNNEHATSASSMLGATPIGIPELTELVHSYLHIGDGFSATLNDHSLILEGVALRTGRYNSGVLRIDIHPDKDLRIEPDMLTYTIEISIYIIRPSGNNYRTLIAWRNYSASYIWEWLTGDLSLDTEVLMRARCGSEIVPPLATMVPNACEELRHSIYKTS